jgi:hypothetical protein
LARIHTPLFADAGPNSNRKLFITTTTVPNWRGMPFSVIKHGTIFLRWNRVRHPVWLGATKMSPQ